MTRKLALTQRVGRTTQPIMRLVAVSVVKNEADVIEAFVRHTRAWVDEHLIFDHDSTDGTRQILFDLVREGLPVRLFTGSAIANLQQSRSNHLASLGFAKYGADWVLPLDADEFLMAQDRAALEFALANGPADRPVSLPLRNYSPTTTDDSTEVNPALRIRHRQPGHGTTNKVFIPRALGTRPDIIAGKGNHALYQDSHAVSSQPLPNVSLAHFALRSPHQPGLRVVTAELQKLSRGKAHEGLDTHYRLGFQLLAEDADLFFSTVLQPAERLQLDPVTYRGEALRYSPTVSAFARSARALIPFLERLAKSHGNLVDHNQTSTEDFVETIAPLNPTHDSGMLTTGTSSFTGFTALSGWQPQEGPIPEAFLPHFHWATAPETTLVVQADKPQSARLEARLLSYAEQQRATIFLNGVELANLQFPRVNQLENLAVPLSLNAGSNQVSLRYATWIESAADPRKLAVIFLSLRIVAI